MTTNVQRPFQVVPARPASTNAAVRDALRDIKPPVAIPAGWLWLVWIAAGLVAAALGAWLFRRWRHRPRARVPEILVPPHVRARDRLRAALERIREPEPFCTRVSQVLRLYLEERFNLHAPDRTTEEFLDELRSSPRLSAAQKEVLAGFLTRCDLVKFAREEPAEPELRDLWDRAARLVDETAAEPEPTPQSGIGDGQSAIGDRQSAIRNPQSAIE